MIVFNKLLNSKREILEKIFSREDKNTPLLITYFNQHCFNIYSKNNRYKELIDKKFSVYPDGIGMYLSLKFLFWKKIQRTDATHLNYLIIDRLIENKEPVFIIGGRFDEAFLIRSLNKKGINLAGYCHGFFNKEEEKSIIVRTSKAKFILIGIGVPNQEYFANEISKSLSGGTIICVGNFLEFYLGTIKRAPVVFQKLGIEWVFRIVTEPGRLWKRYFLGIPEFLYRIIKLRFAGPT
ncbi:MAG: WecB/TagA/CpsF family glycosyltransferase [Candidatus Thorarchaeota archaeon]